MVDQLIEFEIAEEISAALKLLKKSLQHWIEPEMLLTVDTLRDPNFKGVRCVRSSTKSKEHKPDASVCSNPSESKRQQGATILNFADIVFFTHLASYIHCGN